MTWKDAPTLAGYVGRVFVVLASLLATLKLLLYAIIWRQDGWEKAFEQLRSDSPGILILLAWILPVAAALALLLLMGVRVWGWTTGRTSSADVKELSHGALHRRRSSPR